MMRHFRRVGFVCVFIIVGACDERAPTTQLNMREDSAEQPSPQEAPASEPASQPEGSAGLTAELRGSLEQLVRGASGASQSWFSAATTNVLRAVDVDSAGHATVDFHDLRTTIGNASSSAGSTALLAELNNAVFQVAGIQSVEYRMDGSCSAFWEWLQYSCHTVTRADWKR